MYSCSTGSCWLAASARIWETLPPISPNSIGGRKKPQFCYAPLEFPSSSKSDDQRKFKQNGSHGNINPGQRQGGMHPGDVGSQLGSKDLAADRGWLRRGLSRRTDRRWRRRADDAVADIELRRESAGRGWHRPALRLDHQDRGRLAPSYVRSC